MGRTLTLNELEQDMEHMFDDGWTTVDDGDTEVLNLPRVGCLVRSVVRREGDHFDPSAPVFVPGVWWVDSGPRGRRFTHEYAELLRGWDAPRDEEEAESDAFYGIDELSSKKDED
jgi:hypothetical protein